MDFYVFLGGPIFSGGFQAQLTNLVYLNLGYNQMVGELPGKALGGLLNLYDIELQNNCKDRLGVFFGGFFGMRLYRSRAPGTRLSNNSRALALALLL